MAATWVILGYQGVCQYQMVREKALGALLKSIKEDNHPLLVSQRFTVDSKPEKLDCFHNGSDVVSEVTGWHKLLRKSARKSDPITEQVLNLIDQKMLLRNPENRIKSGKLCDELKHIVMYSNGIIDKINEAESLSDRNLRGRIEGFLREIDDEAVSQVIEEVPKEPSQSLSAGLPVDRNALKVQLNHVALQKTSHRFETIPEPLTRTTNSAAVVGKTSTRTQPSETHQDPGFTLPEGHLVQIPTFGLSSRTTTGNTFLPHRKSGNSSSHVKQNVIQARESMDRERSFSFSTMSSRTRLRRDQYLSNFFKDRDIKFLVDDAESMCQHWDEATFLLETLVMKSHGQDPDGPDLSFANNQTKLRRQKDPAAYRKAMETVQPRKEHGVHTNMRTALQPILNSYYSIAKRAHDKSEVNALTIIILTDGLWDGMNEKNDIIPQIVQFYKSLEHEMGVLMKYRQVSIQFVQFGDDEEARERLRRLDDDMPYRGIEDIVDHEKFSVTGDVFKMLLGSFVEEIDARDDSAEILSSPEKSPHNQATAVGPTRNLPMRAISEEITDSLPPPVQYDYNAQPRPAAFSQGLATPQMHTIPPTPSGSRSPARPQSMVALQAAHSRRKSRRVSEFFFGQKEP
jgi:hypothetical protein